MGKLKGKSPGTVEPGKTKSVIFGASGAGKTWFTLTFPAPYYIDTEGGAQLKHYQDRLKRSGGAYLGPEEGSLDFDVIIDQIRALVTEKHAYKTLVIDSITKVFQVAIANEQERLGEKDAFGASKKPAIAKMRQLINWIDKLDMNVWLVAHETAEWGVNPKTGQREEVGKIPDVWDKTVYELDLGLQVQKRGNIPVPWCKVHKSRLLGFPQGSGFELDYKGFAERYGKDYIEAETKQIVLATDSNVAEIKRLVEILKVPDTETGKLLSRAKADSWADMTDEQARKTIVWLKSKLEGSTK